MPSQPQRQPPDWEFAVLTADGFTTKVALRVIFRGEDVYAVNPALGKPFKKSLHKSGRQHIQRGAGDRQLAQVRTPPLSTFDEEWVTSFDLRCRNLPDFENQRFTDTRTVDLRELPDGLAVGEISIGCRFFNKPEFQQDGCAGFLLKEEVIERDQEPHLCLRVWVLQG